MLLRQTLLGLSKQIRNCVKYSTNEISTERKRIFSGIQPTGQVHLGNYLGAIAQWVNLQNQNEDVILELADLHSITLPQDPTTLRNNILEMTATLLGCGIDPEKIILFQQSDVKEHAELGWCLGCVCTMARLAHLPAFKEKSAALKDVPLGLYVYPVLQAADILAYKATHVPVGEDQVQHIQLTKELARMFNKRYGETFNIPHALIISGEYARLKSLREPAKKMSKSDPDPKARICLTDPPNEIEKKFKKAVTDCISDVYFNPKERPGVSNLISIHSFVTNKSIEDICNENKHINTGQYKKVVADAVIEHVQPIQERISHLLKNKDFLLKTLEIGAEKAREISSQTIHEVKYKLGLQFSKIKSEKEIVQHIKVHC